MQHIVIDKKGSQLQSERNLLIIQHPSFSKPLRIPISQVQSLTLTTQVDLSSTLLTRLAKNNVSVCVVPSSQKGAACFLLGSWHAGVKRRIQQYEVIEDESSRRYWASLLVRLKLHQQANTLTKIRHYYLLDSTEGSASQHVRHQELTRTIEAIQKIKSLRDKFRRYYSTTKYSTTRHTASEPRMNAGTASRSLIYTDYMPQYPIPSLLGTEGIASAIYFDAYQSFFCSELTFNNRNRRPPKDPVNVVLSLAYTLLQHLCQNAIYSVGFDPYRGVLHSPSYGRESLACDFAELQRGVIDYWVWQMFEQGTLASTDFSTTSSNGYPCELLKSGRSKFYKAFAAIRSDLFKTALSHVWIWQKRLQRYHHSEPTVPMPASPTFISNTASLPQISI